MNCRNCGAPMTLVPFRNYFVCSFCTTFAFPDDAEATGEGVVSLQTGSEHDCPVCAETLTEGSLDGHRVQYCSICRGILATNDDFGLIVRGRRIRYMEPSHPPVPLNVEELDREVRCPVCARRMETHPYYGPGRVVVDTCSRCHVVWLDHGELSVIEAAPGKR